MLHPFGSGLQYNSWTVSSLQLSHTTISAEALRASEAGGSLRGQVAATAVVNVTATAKHSGAFPRSSIPLLLFAASPRAGSDGRPLRTLVGFERVAAAVGEEVTATIGLEARRLMLADVAGEWQPHRGQWTLELEASGVHSTGLRVV